MKTENEMKNLSPAPITPLPTRKSLGQHVFENLKQAIIRGDIAPGNRLVESRIAATMDISRTPVREAIHKLEREGLIEKLPKGGFSVLGLSRENIEETFGIRRVLESYAARLAAEKHREEDLFPLDKKIREFQQCLDNGQVEDLAKINTEFHNLLYALSQSPKLIKMISDLMDQIYRFRKILMKVEDMPRAGNEDHRLMLRAIRDRDLDRVESLVKEHILRGQRAVLNALGNNPERF